MLFKIKWCSTPVSIPTIACYRPQQSYGQGNIFTPVCHSVYRGDLPQCMLGYHPPPLDQSDPPGQGRPPRPGRPPRTRQRPPRDRQTPPLGSRLQHMVYERPVRILLECIIVIICTGTWIKQP